jgi:hypothetical protein
MMVHVYVLMDIMEQHVMVNVIQIVLNVIILVVHAINAKKVIILKIKYVIHVLKIAMVNVREVYALNAKKVFMVIYVMKLARYIV